VIVANENVTPEEEKIAEELELQCRRQGVHDLEPLAKVMQYLEEANQKDGRAVLVAAGIWYYAKLVTGHQAGKADEAMEIDRMCEHMARVMRRDKVL
jgi:hypothetical protein